MFDSKMLTSFVIKSSLYRYSNIKIGDKVTYLVAPQSISDLAIIIKEAKAQNLEILPVGGGSNILFGDVGNRVIILDANLPEIFDVKEDIVTTSSNIKISSFIDKAMQYDLGGLEFISGIPAHIGGAINMNAGAFGKCIFDYVLWIEYVNLEGNIIKLEREDLNFGYRTTSIDGFIIRAGLKLDKKTKKQILDAKENIISMRLERHPYDYPSLGSTFKNPDGKFAGQLIEECGLKGLQIGNAQISEKHANFILNKGNATFEDVTEIIRIVKKAVKEQKNIELELEIRIIN
ncbi:MAG: UDP-N-acetylmuramate dehydrogenase [Candidatus Tenebribacter mawsonii]|nr:UDP-N-acetylmuramate dehydrogenase [Candidatus Tenebribacter mawsonii]